MDASRYFDAMHNAMSAQHPGAQLLLTVKLQDTCGNDACLELKQLPGESTSILCYSTMGRRCLSFQLFRKGWQLCHNADGQLVGRFPASANGLIDETDFRAYCREDRLDLARTQRILSELQQCAGVNYRGRIPQDARTGAQITVESFVGTGARWVYWSQDAAPSLPLAAILYWLADFLAGAERRTLQADPQAARLAAQWLAGDTAVFFHPTVPQPSRRACRPEQELAEHHGRDGKHVRSSLRFAALSSSPEGRAFYIREQKPPANPTLAGGFFCVFIPDTGPAGRPPSCCAWGSAF